MVNTYNATRLAVQAGLSSALLAAVTSASAVTVDGDLADLQTAIANAYYYPQNTASVTESGTDGEANGFDIVNGYAWYSVALDTFYLGMTFNGQVGTAGGREGAPTQVGCAPAPNYDGVAGVFDACERYGFGIDIDGDSTYEYEFTLRGDGSADSGEGSEQIVTLADNTGLGLGSATVDWIVSEGNNAVEFSISGLYPLLAPFGPSDPRDVDILLRAGSLTNTGNEDTLVMNMQVVPVPAAVWLFGSGLVGLFGLSRKSSRK